MVKVIAIFADLTEGPRVFKALGNFKVTQGEVALGRRFQAASVASVSYIFKACKDL